MRPHLLATILLAALTLAASNQFGGGSFGGTTHGRANRAPVVQITGTLERDGPGDLVLGCADISGDAGFPASPTYSWDIVFNPPLCSNLSGQETDTLTITMPNTTDGCFVQCRICEGVLCDTGLAIAGVTEDQPPEVSVSMQPVTEGENLNISGSATDDSGGTCGTGLTCTHTMIQAPAGDAGSFSDASAEDPTYGVVAAGGYEDRLCADDGVNAPVCDTTGLINVADSEATCVPEVAGFAHFDICAGGDDPFAAGRWDTGSSAIAADFISSGWPVPWQYDAAEDVIYMEATGSIARGAAVYLTDLASVDGNACFEVAELPSGGTWDVDHLLRASGADNDFETYVTHVNESSEIRWERFHDLDLPPFTTVNGPAAQAISVGDVFCLRVTGEGGNETRTAYFDATYPADADPTTWTADHTFTSPDGTVSSGLATGVRAFLSASTTGRIALKNWGAGSTDPVGPVEEAILNLTPTSCSRSMEEGETVLDCPFQACNDGNVVLDDWAFAVQGTPDDITTDGSSPNSAWLGASDSGTNLSAGTCENVTATITGEENGDVGSYSGTVRASTNDADSTVATVDRTVSLTINEVGTGEIDVAIECEHPSNLAAPVAIQCDAVGTTHGDASVDTFADLYYSWDAAGCKHGNWGDANALGADANDYLQRFPRGEHEGGPLFGVVCETPGSKTITVTARDADGGSDTTTYDFTVDDPDSTFSGTSTVCVGRASEPTAGSGGCPAGAATVQTTSCSSATFGTGKRILFNRGETWGGPCFTNVTGPMVVGAFGTGDRPSFSGGDPAMSGQDVRIMDVEVSTSSDDNAIETTGPDLLVLRSHVHGGFRNVIATGSSTRLAVVDSIIENAGSSEGPVPYNIFAEVPDRAFFAGNVIRGSGGHNFRVVYFNKMFVGYSVTGGQEKGNWRFHAETGSKSSRYVEVGYNTGSDWHIVIASKTAEPGFEVDIDDVLVHGNYFMEGGGTPISCGAERCMFRNNVMRGPSNPLSVFLRNDQTQHVGPAYFYNNTFFCSSGSPDMLTIRESGGEYQSTAYAKGNLYYCTNTASPDITDGDPDWVTDSNVAIGSGGTCPFASCPPGSGAGNLDDYELNAGASGAIDGGFTMTVDDAVIRDLKGDDRSNPADAGALER